MGEAVHCESDPSGQTSCQDYDRAGLNYFYCYTNSLDSYYRDCVAITSDIRTLATQCTGRPTDGDKTATICYQSSSTLSYYCFTGTEPYFSDQSLYGCLYKEIVSCDSDPSGLANGCPSASSQFIYTYSCFASGLNHDASVYTDCTRIIGTPSIGYGCNSVPTEDSSNPCSSSVMSGLYQSDRITVSCYQGYSFADQAAMYMYNCYQCRMPSVQSVTSMKMCLELSLGMYHCEGTADSALTTFTCGSSPNCPGVYTNCVGQCLSPVAFPTEYYYCVPPANDAQLYPTACQHQLTGYHYTTAYINARLPYQCSHRITCNGYTGQYLCTGTSSIWSVYGADSDPSGMSVNSYTTGTIIYVIAR